MVVLLGVDKCYGQEETGKRNGQGRPPGGGGTSLEETMELDRWKGKLTHGDQSRRKGKGLQEEGGEKKAGEISGESDFPQILRKPHYFGMF